MAQFEAQGINLIFFIPIALLSLIIHTKNKLVRWKQIIPAILLGTISAGLSAYLASGMDNKILTKLFAVLVFFAGIKEIFTKTRN